MPHLFGGTIPILSDSKSSDRGSIEIRLTTAWEWLLMEEISSLSLTTLHLMEGSVPARMRLLQNREVSRCYLSFLSQQSAGIGGLYLQTNQEILQVWKQHDATDFEWRQKTPRNIKHCKIIWYRFHLKGLYKMCLVVSVHQQNMAYCRLHSGCTCNSSDV